MDYGELVKALREHQCDAKEDDTQDVCEECAYDVILADKSTFSGIKDVCTCGLMHRAANAIEELQKHYCRHAIHNEHDRGDDSLCDVLLTEPPRVDPCADCVHSPPSSTDGKPCCACNPANPLTNCHEAKEKTE